MMFKTNKVKCVMGKYSLNAKDDSREGIEEEKGNGAHRKHEV